MSSVPQRILIYIISTTINVYDFNNLYGNAKNILFVFFHIDIVIRKKLLEAIVDLFQICLVLLFQYVLGGCRKFVDRETWV